MRQRALIFVLIAAALAGSGCGSKVLVGATEGGGGDGAAGTTTTGAGAGGAGGTTTTGDTIDTGTPTTDPPCDPGDPDQDQDGDGFTEIAGDCDDCDPSANPDAVEVPANFVDDNCDGELDEPLAACDADIAMDTLVPEEIARAIELCKTSAGAQSWGLVQAHWVLPDGTPPPIEVLDGFHVGHGVLPDFGPNVAPGAGKKLAAFSSGTARRPGDPNFDPTMGFNKSYQAEEPPGFPKNSPSCPGIVSGSPWDAVALEVEVRVPTNAHGFGFDFNFYSAEYPGVCTPYDDTFFALLSPQLPGQPDGNVVFDDMGNPVTVNHVAFHVCGCADGPPCLAGGKLFDCALGTAGLMGNGFDTGAGMGATGWLHSVVPADPSSVITLRWGVYDAGDGNATTTALVDNWVWITEEGQTVGVPVGEGEGP